MCSEQHTRRTFVKVHYLQPKLTRLQFGLKLILKLVVYCYKLALKSYKFSIFPIHFGWTIMRENIKKNITCSCIVLKK